MNRFLLFMLLSGLVRLAIASPAVEFSAQTVHVTPNQPERTARMYVGKNHVRMEYEKNGQQLAEITDTRTQHSVLLFLKLKQYMEKQAAEQSLKKVDLIIDTNNPCSKMPGATCTLLGQEKASGRTAQKSEVVTKQRGVTQRALIWMDIEHNMPLRQLLPDGTVSELHISEMERIGNRNAEKWEIIVTKPDSQIVTSRQWFDPELKIAIREELPGGYLRELRNIVVAPQDKNLFLIPNDYTLSRTPGSKGRKLKSATP
jgi:hypothetical protein